VETITTSTSSKTVWRNGRKYRVPNGGNSTFITLSFQTQEGKPMEIETLATFDTQAQEGEKLPLVYLPWSVDTAKIYSAKQLWLPMIVGTIFTAACLIGGLIMLPRRPRL
jgi:hypothetical protein